MQIEYRTRQLELVCTDARVASRQYGDFMARRINLCIKQIRMVEKWMNCFVSGSAATICSPVIERVNTRWT